MTDYQFEKYNIEVVENEMGKASIKINPPFGLAHGLDMRKIYIVHTETEVLYVGEAKTSIKKRFQRGCAAYNFFIGNYNVARKGYQGYKWLNPNHNPIRTLSLSVAIFPEDYNEKRTVIEAIEGEIVYLIRKVGGKWPTFQNEIHFSNQKKAESIAINIMKQTQINGFS